MTMELDHYLESVRYNSKLDVSEEREVLGELQAHIEDRLQELTESGLPEGEAIKTCLWQMGPATSVAREIYEAYSQRSWKQVALASMPHLLLALFFAFNWWQYLGWLSILLLLILGMTLYGWRHGKPAWVFSWLGYSLLPLLAAGLILVNLPRGWPLLAVTYIPLASWWFLRVIIQTTRRDWLFSSIILLPLPVIIGWILVMSPGAGLSEYTLQRIYYFAPWIGLSFLALALTIATFLRLRQRRLRISVLIISGLLTLTLIVLCNSVRLNTPAFLGLALVLWGFSCSHPFWNGDSETGSSKTAGPDYFTESL